ncbi:MAG: Nif11 family protein [Chloroflexi bacterium]|nr:Nif11 family protein [Chloroflexota bacterium]
MSLQAALHFIQYIREDEALINKIKSLGVDADLQAIVNLGAERGYHFSPAELRIAHKQDWAMRWLWYQSPQDAP